MTELTVNILAILLTGIIWGTTIYVSIRLGQRKKTK
jgi:hypothetical protein